MSLASRGIRLIVVFSCDATIRGVYLLPPGHQCNFMEDGTYDRGGPDSSAVGPTLGYGIVYECSDVR